MNIERLSPILFAAFGLGYWLSLWTPGFPGDWAVKAAPMLLAAGVLCVRLPARLGVPMTIGFVAAAAGDMQRAAGGSRLLNVIERVVDKQDVSVIPAARLHELSFDS